MSAIDRADLWSRRLDRLERTWLEDAYGVAPLTAVQRQRLTRQLRAARAAHADACREAVA